MSPASDIHGRRHTATNASYQRGVSTDAIHASQSSAPNGAGTGASTRAASARTSAPTSCTDRGDIECTASPASMQRGRVLPAVLLVVHDDEIGRERDDRGDVGVLRPADRRHAGELAEPRARDRRDAERDQRLARRRNQRDDTRTALRRSHALEQLRLLRLELRGGDHAAVAQVGELLELLGNDVARRGAARRRRAAPPARLQPARVCACASICR